MIDFIARQFDTATKKLWWALWIVGFLTGGIIGSLVLSFTLFAGHLIFVAAEKWDEGA